MIELDQLHHVQIQKKVEVHQKVLHQKEQKQLVKKPKKRKTKRKVKKSKRKVKKPKRKTKRKARGLVNEHFMNSLTDNRYIPDNRSGIELIEHQSYGMNPDGSRITPRVEGKIKTTRTLVSSSKPKSTIKKTRKHT